MELIVITAETPVVGEARLVGHLVDAGVSLVHLRRPAWDRATAERWLRSLPQELLGRIVLHDWHSLALEMPLGGIHLNGRNPRPPEGYRGYVSASCHSLEEVAERKRACDRVMLSPIFDSLSKRGYRAAFTSEELSRARDAGIIDSRVCALGGVTLDALPPLEALGFGAAAMLGEPWAAASSPPSWQRYLAAVRKAAGH